METLLSLSWGIQQINDDRMSYLKLYLIISLIGAEKFLLEKEKKSLHDLSEKWDPRHLELDEDFNEYMENDGLENNVRYEGM